MSSAAPRHHAYYFVPAALAPSGHGVRSACSASSWARPSGSTAPAGASTSLLFGMLWLFGVLFQWFGDAIGESEGGYYGHKVDLSFRWSMSWFIFSEVMFFGAFFTALWWMRSHSVPALGGLDNALLWPDFKAVWPTRRRRATGFAGRHHRALPDHDAVLAADHQHRAAADLGRDADHRPPRAAREPSRQDDRVHVAHRAAGRHLRGVQGYEYFHAVHRAEPEAHAPAPTARPSSC